MLHRLACAWGIQDKPLVRIIIVIMHALLICIPKYKFTNEINAREDACPQLYREDSLAFLFSGNGHDYSSILADCRESNETLIQVTTAETLPCKIQ